MSASSEAIGTGLGAWFGHIGDTLVGMRTGYGKALRKSRARTVVLTVIIVLGLIYPVLHQQFLAEFSRNVFPLPLPDDTAMTFMMIFAIMAVGLNIVVGFAGLLDLGYVAFYAIGAYVAAFLASPHWAALGINLTFLGNVGPGAQGVHLPYWIVVIVAVIVVATFGALLGAPTLRLRGDYLAIVTLGFGEIVPLVFKNLSSLTISLTLGPIVIALENVNLTGGVQGINPIDPPFLPFFNILFDSRSGPLAVYLGVFLLAIAVVVARNLQFSRIGRSWMAIREDETAAADDGRQHRPLEAPGVRARREPRRRRGLLPGLLPRRDDLRLLRVLDLDPRPDHGHPRRRRERLGRHRGCDRPDLHRQDVPALPGPARPGQPDPAAEPGPVQLPRLRHHPAGHDAVPTAGLPAGSPARG